MRTQRFEARAYLDGGSALIRVDVYVESERFVNLHTEGRPSRRLALSGEELEPFGPGQVCLDLPGAKLVFSKDEGRRFEKATRGSRAPWWKPIALSVGGAAALFFFAYGAGWALEILDPPFLRKATSANTRQFLGVCEDAGRPQLDALMERLDAKDVRLYFADVSLPNAFALPDDTIVFTQGILSKLDANSFVGVLGHELGHIRLGHTRKLLGRKAMVQQLFSVLYGNWGELMATAGLSHFSRVQESEADRFGKEVLDVHGIDSRSTGQFFLKLSGGKDPLAFLSTHPDYPTRVATFDDDKNANAKPFLFAKDWKILQEGCHSLRLAR